MHGQATSKKRIRGSAERGTGIIGLGGVRNNQPIVRSPVRILPVTAGLGTQAFLTEDG